MRTLSRRRFLSTTTTALLALPCLTRRASGAGTSLPPGIQLYCVRQPLEADTPGTLRAVRQIGFTEVETAGFGRYTAAEFGGLLRAADLRCPSAHLPFYDTPEPGPLFDQAHALGATYATSSILRSFAPPPAASGAAAAEPVLPPLGLEGFQRMAARMNDLGRGAKAAGLVYAYHNHNFEFERMPDGSFGYDLLLRESDPDLVKFELDCGWMIIAGAKPVDYFHRYPGRFRMIHVKDFRPQPTATLDLIGPNRPVGIELGRGFMDYRPILAAAKLAGVQHAFAEQEAPYRQPQLESAKISFAYLKSVE